MVLLSHINWSEQFKLQWRESSRWLTKSTPSSDHRWETPLCALSSCQRSTVEYRAPQLNVSEQLLRDVKAAASKRNNDLRAAREEAAAINNVAVESEDESDDEWS